MRVREGEREHRKSFFLPDSQDNRKRGFIVHFDSFSLFSLSLSLEEDFYQKRERVRLIAMVQNGKEPESGTKREGGRKEELTGWMTEQEEWMDRKWMQ